MIIYKKEGSIVQYSVPMKLLVVRLIKMSLNETYIKFHVGKLLSDNFLIQNGLMLASIQSRNFYSPVQKHKNENA
jgi:hypothetical protein